MIAVGHTAVGVIVGIGMTHLLPASMPLWESVMITGTAGIVSHYVMDLVPHGHYDFDFTQPSQRERLILALDLIIPVGFAIGLILWRHGWSVETWLVVTGMAGAQLPDIVNGLRAKGWLPRWRILTIEGQLHALTHWHNPADPQTATREGGRKIGLSDVWQWMLILLSLLLLFRS